MEHTPGPWELDSAKDADGRYFIINGQAPKGINEDFGYPVADTLNRHHCISPEEDEGNARILAAAPEMFKLLEAIDNFWGQGICEAPIHPGAYITDQDVPICELIHAAIRKARGEKEKL